MADMKAVKYGSFDMQSGGVTVVETPDLYSAPTNNIQADELAERDGALVVKQQYGKKNFTVNGYLRSTTAAGLEVLMDAFKAAIAQKNQPFDIDHAGSIRRYLGSAVNDIISRSGPSSAGFSVQLLSPDGMGWDTDSSSLISSTNVSQSAATIAFTVGGSYKAEPYIRVTINTATGVTSKTLTLGNSQTLRTVTITRTWANGDVIEMDALKGELLVNGIPTDYRGTLIAFEPGDQGLTWNDEFTTRDATVLATYTKRWL